MVARQHQCVDLLIKAKVNNAGKSLPRRGADQVGQGSIPHRKRLERGIKVDVGRVDETKSQMSTPPVCLALYGFNRCV
jgi:hypothetical protein